MHDPETLDALQAFGQRNLTALRTLMPDPDVPAWAGRLQGWLAVCALTPHAALRDAALENAVVDLITLELACQSYAPAKEGLQMTDRGGTVWTRRTLADLLLLLGEWDTKMARNLASLAQSSRNERLGQIRCLITERM